jgi:RecA/RadA recombinase
MPKSSAAAKAALKKFDESWAKSYGDETIVNTTKVTPYEVISTGSLSLDDATEVGGLVEGRIVESWGPEDTGKSTLAIIAAAQAQKKHPDKLVAYIDMERKHDLKWMQTNGLNITRGALRILKPKSAEEVADMVKDLDGHRRLGRRHDPEGRDRQDGRGGRRRGPGQDRHPHGRHRRELL